MSSSWRFSPGFWAVEGLRGNNVESGEKAWIALETPFVTWAVRNAIHLPEDKVLLQLGGDQICIYDPVENRIALLARGRGPYAVLEE